MPDTEFRLSRRQRVPVLLQQERSECGLACLAMIASHYGRTESLQTIRALAGSAGRGSTLKDLTEVAQHLVLIPRALRVSLDELPRLRLPAVLHWKMDHYVVLTRCTKKGVVVHDPAIGKRRVSLAELDQSFTGVALELRPAANFTKGSAPVLSLISIARSFDRIGRFLALTLFLLLVIQLLSLVPAVATQLLIDNIVQGQDRRWLYGVLAGTGCIMLAAAALDGMRKWIGLYAGTRLMAESSSSVLFHLFSLPPQFVQSRLVGDLMSRIESLNPVRQAITDHSISAIVQFIVLLTTVTVMCFYSIELAAITALSVLVSGGLALAIVPASRRLTAEQLIHNAGQNSSLMESLRATTAVFALGLKQARLAQWQTHFHSGLDAGIRQGKLRIFQETVGAVIQALDQMLFLGVGIVLVLDQSITLGALFAFFTLRARFGTSALTLLATVQSFLMVKVHTQRLADVVLAEACPAPRPGSIVRPLQGNIKVRDLRFRYSRDAWILDGFSCDIRRGYCVVIAGPSGGGKTTLLKLLSGQLTANEGRLEFDGFDLSLWNQDHLRQQFGVVSQDDALFQGTVAENICCFDPQPDFVRLQQVALMAELWRDIQEMPMQLHTLIGDMGCCLSGGQRQRMCLARALYRQPTMLFLDEATSHLDTNTENRILDRLESLEITTISVAHRPDVLRRAGYIISVGNPPVADS